MKEEELKTLNDIQSFELTFSGDGFEHLKAMEGMVLKKDVRQKAIKWIKGLSETGIFSDCNVGGFDFGNFSLDYEKRYGKNNKEASESNASTLIRWIKHFFNITEEDLK